MASTQGSRPSPTQTTVPTDESIIFSIVEAIATVTEADPAAVDVQLSDHVDLDALESLYAHATANEESTWEVQLRIDQLQVTIHSDGRITVV